MMGHQMSVDPNAELDSLYKTEVLLKGAARDTPEWAMVWGEVTLTFKLLSFISPRPAVGGGPCQVSVKCVLSLAIRKLALFPRICRKGRHVKCL